MILDIDNDLTYFKSHKLIIVSGLSTGGVPSHCIDLLITANKFKRTAFVKSQKLSPSVGYLNKNIQKGDLGLPGEVYQKDDVIIFQFRSGIRFGRKKQFINQLYTIFTKHEQYPQILVLSSLPYSTKPDIQISTDKYVYYYNKTITGSPIAKVLQNSKELKPIKQLLVKDEEQSEILKDAGLINQFSKEKKFTKVSALFVFSSQALDPEIALFLAKTVRSVVGIQGCRKQLGQPVSLKSLE